MYLREPILRCRNVALAPQRRWRLGRMSARGEAPMCVLFYHRVADTYPNGWTISRRDFARHVDHCRRHFELVGLDEVQRRVRENHSPGVSVTFTFDDGYAENCEFALPLLARHAVPTVYFVATGHVLGQRPFPHDVHARRPLPVNTPAQLREWADRGIEIGLHTRNHADFSVVRKPRDIHREVVAAKHELESLIGRPVRYFAVPYGLPEHVTQAVVDATVEAGLWGFCTAYGAYNLPGRDAFHLRRIHGDPGFARLQNWLQFDPRKLRREPNVAYVGPADSVRPNPSTQKVKGQLPHDATLPPGGWCF